MSPDSEHEPGSDVIALERHAAAVRSAAARTRFRRVNWVAATGSTNDDLAATAAAGGPEQVLIADLQTAGRGRRDRRWTAPAASGLLMSFLIRDEPGRPPFWTIGTVALAAAEAATVHAGVEVELKWPNDLMIGDAKVAGILAARVNDATVVGMGLNVDWSAGRPDGVPAHATALDRHGRRGALDRPGLAGDIVVSVDRWLREPLSAIRDGWHEHCATLDREVRVEMRDGDLVGRAVGLDADGALIVRRGHDDHVVHVGDVVHLRPTAGRRPN